MAGEFECRPEVLQGIAQSLLEMKKMARSIEQSADALRPLATPETDQVLEVTMESANSISNRMGKLYASVAKEALG